MKIMIEMSEIQLKESSMIDLFTVIIDPQISSTVCCICFNRSDKCMKLDEYFEFLYENEVETMSLYEIISYLVRTQEIILNQACITCTKLLLEFYKILKQREKKISQLKTITNTLNNEVNNISPSTKIMLYLTENSLIKTKNKCMEQSTEITKKISTSKVAKPSRKPSNNITTSLLNKSKLTDSKENLQEKKTQESYVTCHNCNRKFSSKKKLTSHVNSHITRTCPFCHKQVKNSSFQRHLKIHKTGTQPHYRTNYDCHECDYKTTCKSSLDAHKYKIHLKIRPFVCTVCNKGFYKKSNLVEHELIHKKKKDLICEVCGQRFSNIKCLKQHICIHSDTKEFKCDYCELRFERIHRKQEHMKSQHSVKSFACTQCNKSYGLQKELNRHIKLTHTESDFVFGDQYA